MLEINTDKSKSRKLVKVDGFDFYVRKPGAGESLAMSQFSKEINKLEAKDKRTKAEQERYETIAQSALSICLKLFEAKDKNGREYLDTLDPETLMNVVAEVHGTAETS